MPPYVVDAGHILALAKVEKSIEASGASPPKDLDASRFGLGHAPFYPPDYWAHDPALGITSTGRLFVVGHGHPTRDPSCNSSDYMCYAERVGGVWTAPQVLATPAPGQSFDASPSIKWSAVGFNRPETVELIVFASQNFDYYNTSIYYAHLD